MGDDNQRSKSKQLKKKGRKKKKDKRLREKKIERLWFSLKKNK